MTNRMADYLIASDIVPEIEKSAPRLHKKQINMNRPGTVAADFTFVSAYGGRRAMHSIAARYTLLLFYDTDCPVCKSAKQAIQSSSVLVRLQKENRLKVLAIYPYEDTAAWEASRDDIPEGWINGRSRVTEGDTPAYHIPVSPMLCLLDKDKRVILKDAPVEQLEAELVAPKPETNR